MEHFAPYLGVAAAPYLPEWKRVSEDPRNSVATAPMSHDQPGPGGPTQASQLAELLECERELAELLAAAEAEAVRMVDEARAAAVADDAEVEASLEDEGERQRVRIREATQRRVRELRAEAGERVALFEGVSDGEVARLADDAFRRLVAREVES